MCKNEENKCHENVIFKMKYKREKSVKEKKVYKNSFKNYIERKTNIWDNIINKKTKKGE